MIGQVVRGAPLVFAAAIVQVSVLNRVDVVGGNPDLLLVTVVCLALLAGATYGAGAGFFAGLLVDTATLQTLGVTSLLLTVSGYWAGRYGETTGRDKPHAPLLTVAVVTALYAVAELGLRFVLAQQVDGLHLLRSVVPTVVLNLLLAPPVLLLCRRLLVRRGAVEGAREVQLLG